MPLRPVQNAEAVFGESRSRQLRNELPPCAAKASRYPRSNACALDFIRLPAAQQVGIARPRRPLRPGWRRPARLACRRRGIGRRSWAQATRAPGRKCTASAPQAWRLHKQIVHQLPHSLVPDQFDFEFFEALALGFRQDAHDEDQADDGKKLRRSGRSPSCRNSRSSQGKTSCTVKLTAELIRPTKEMARPRSRLGNSSENSTHITGPSEIAKLGHEAQDTDQDQRRVHVDGGADQGGLVALVGIAANSRRRRPRGTPRRCRRSGRPAAAAPPG